MSFKILTKNGIENTNIDGARSNNFMAGRRSGVSKGVLNECVVVSTTSNGLSIGTGEIRLCGHIIVVTEAETITFVNTPSTAQNMALIAQIVVSSASVPTFSFVVQDAVQTLIQDDLDLSATGSGTYQIKLATFIQNTDGTISSLVNVVDKITGSAINDEDYYNKTEINALIAPSTAHIANKNNPHEVTKTQVGLENVDNTSDIDKPISNATQTAINGINNSILNTQNELKNTELKVSDLYAYLEAGDVITNNTVEDKYQTRETGNGLSIIDGTSTIVNKIQGNTVKCENLIDITQGLNANLVDNGNGTYTYTKIGTARTTSNDIPLVLSAGTQITISLNVIENTTGQGNFIPIMLRNGNTTVQWATGNPVTKTLTSDITAMRLTFDTLYPDGTYIKFKDLQINIGSTVLPYQPYFTGLKNASISGILSASQDGTKTSSLTLPETTELKEFDYIDLDNQKKVIQSVQREYQTGDTNSDTMITDGATQTVYKADTATETDYVTPNQYIEYTGGTESIQGNINNEYGTEVTITQEIITLGGTN